MVKKIQTQTKKAGDETGYLNGKIPVKQKKPVQQSVTPISNVMLPKSDKKSYWSTPEGKARAKQMSEDMKKHGKLITRTKGK